MTADRGTDVSVVMLAYGAEPFLFEAVDAVLSSRGVRVEVVVVDNGCASDLSALERRSGVRVLRPGSNTGFAGGCNLGAAATSAAVLALVNSDAVVEPDALAELAAVARRLEVGLVSGSIRLAGTPELMNSAGNPVHVLGLSWAGGLGEPAERHAVGTAVASASGAALAVRREVWDALGGFTTEFFAYQEDCDLSLRCWQRGWEVRFVPEAVIAHHYEFSRNPLKFYLLERNRLAMLLTVYGGRLLVLLAPALLALELAMLAVALRQGWMRQKLRGYRWLMSNRGWLRRRRREVQAVRVVGDRDLAGLLTGHFDPVALPLPVGAGALNALMSGYWRLVRRLL
ncbi:MAG: glycosyltransferase family 2 protein [Actinomycetota bacterium]|nr:glycosyltransferase family 2 protein [Actinomycetota bacterium]